MKEIELDVLEFTDLPNEIQDLLQSREIVPDFCSTIHVDSMLAFAIHAPSGEQDDRCMTLIFTFMHGCLWQMMLETRKANTLHRVIGTFVHEELPEIATE
jgi:hypothetical protein